MDRAPSAVLKSLDYIHTAISEASINMDRPFNEVLSAAYMEAQKMSVSQRDLFSSHESAGDVCSFTATARKDSAPLWRLSASVHLR